MDLGTIGAKALKKYGKLTDLDESEEINACSVKIKVDVDGEDQDWLLMFKNETHNHPTEIEPILVVLQLVLVVQFVIHFRDAVMYIKQCV